IEYKDKRHKLELAQGASIEQALRKIGYNPAEFITVLNNVIVTELEELSDGDKVKLLKVWSGG
ncbi:MAG: MoaD/ThiS family protein, partial [Candidatus Altiarchaeota archaeon]|nr:MoaD/ThiS family protein [Candidatus Altiarchaeota archaeon]